MKTVFKIAVLFTALLNCMVLTSCDKEEALDAWETSYVYLTGGTLSPSLYIGMQHTPIGITPNMQQFNLKVRLSQTQKSDIVVTLATTDVPAETLEFPASIVIPAGKTELIVPVKFKNLAWTGKTELGQKVYNFTIFIEKIKTSNKSIKIGEKHRAYPIILDKSEYTAIKLETPSGTPIADRSIWGLTVDGAPNAATSKLIDSSKSTECAFSEGSAYKLYSLEIDLKSEQELTGMVISYNYKSSTAAEMEFYTSTNGTDWTLYGTAMKLPKEKSHPFTFVGGLKTRYLKIKPTKTNNGSPDKYRPTDVSINIK